MIHVTLNAVLSVTGSLIRLNAERWAHIVETHCELAGLREDVLDTVARPQRVLAGSAGEHLAIREIESGKWLVVVYRDLPEPGFVITAFVTRRQRSLERRRQLWPPQPN
jgi:hypothetical protein